MCSCDKCKFDIAALALNYLPPRYIVTERGETYTRIKSLEQQFNVDIMSAITLAISIVRGRPKHHAD
ncbi:late competence development ComFB family protein [bacterium BFN5]|nr:late competence development ComFB family protein [bacterium BFN5]